MKIETALELNTTITELIMADRYRDLTPSLVISSLIHVLLNICATTTEPGKHLEAARESLGGEHCEEIIAMMVSKINEYNNGEKK